MDVIGFGALNLDKMIHVDKIPHPGDESFLKSMEYFPGGSAANTIAALAKLQVQCGFVGKIGSDAEGSILIENMMYHGVDARGIKLCEGRSGICIILVDKNGERAIVADPGVNDCIDIKDVSTGYFENAKLLHLSAFACRESKKSLETQKKIARNVSSSGTMISFDPGHFYAKMGFEEIRDIMKRTDILFVNEAEANMLTGMDYKKAAENLRESGACIVVVKLGENGCFVKKGKEEYSVPAFRTKAVDTTGAGDAFNAGFLYGILNKKSLEACARLGNAEASFCIKKSGARECLPGKEELMRFVNSGIMS